MSARRAQGGRVIRLSPELILRSTLKRRAGAPAPGCGKCGSTFVVREPAFVHCRYCGKLTRLPDGSLLDQELFERRSGLRVAS